MLELMYDWVILLCILAFSNMFMCCEEVGHTTPGREAMFQFQFHCKPFKPEKSRDVFQYPQAPQLERLLVKPSHGRTPGREVKVSVSVCFTWFFGGHGSPAAPQYCKQNIPLTP